MEEIEQHFDCPFCGEPISMLIDVSVEGEQSYIEDCEVCCRPVQISFEVEEAELRSFQARNA